MHSDPKVLVVIPARLDSTRLSRKVLTHIGGKSMLAHVYDRARQAGYDVVVATEDDEIMDHVIKGMGGYAVKTAIHHNGTSRCLEAFRYMEHFKGVSYDILINVQGDEPMLRFELLHQLVKRLSDTIRPVDIATVAYRVKPTESISEKSDVFIVKNKFNEALYFSRSVIPHIREVHRDEWSKHHSYLKHIGLYAFKAAVVDKLARLDDGILDQLEKLEQLQWLENGLILGLIETDYKMYSVDTPEDLKRVQSILTS